MPLPALPNSFNPLPRSDHLRRVDLRETHTRSLEKLRATAALRLRRQRQIQQLCRTPRLVLELLNELDRHHGLGDDLDRRLAKFAAVDLTLLRALGADRFPDRPLYLVEACR